MIVQVSEHETRHSFHSSLSIFLLSLSHHPDRSLCFFFFLSVCLFLACLSVSLCVHLSLCLAVNLSICLSVCLSVCLSLCQSVCLSFCLSVCLSVCFSVYLSHCVFTFHSPDLWAVWMEVLQIILLQDTPNRIDYFYAIWYEGITILA